MKKYLLLTIMMVFLVGCGNSDAKEAVTDTQANSGHTHSYTEEITTEATCEVDGLKTLTCECGDSYTEVITATGHNYEEVADSAVEATCDADGKEADTKCSLCEGVAEGVVIPATGHSYGEYVYNNDATTSADGTETATCSVCGGKDTRTKAGTKLEISYVGYDEFGNGYTLDANGDKVFYVDNPYPINQIVDNGDWLYYYGVYGEPQKSLECENILQERYGVPMGHYNVTEDGEWILEKKYIYTETTRLGYYNGKMILYVTSWVDLD